MPDVTANGINIHYEERGRGDPLVLIMGLGADIFTPLRFSEGMHERMPNSELLVFPGLGHCHHWEDLEAFNSRTTEFLLNN